MKYKQCNIEKVICTESPNNNTEDLNVNTAISNGTGYSKIKQLYAILNASQMLRTQYEKLYETVPVSILK